MSRVRETGNSPVEPSAGRGVSGRAERAPAWRRIEVWRERQALKRALADLESDDPELDETIFLQDPAHRGRYFTPDDPDAGQAPDEAGEEAGWDDESS